ncbi:hypothetical protein V8E54_001906 [Elaphomyces granulatus]
MGGGRAFDIDAFLEFMPGQEGEAWEKREEHHPSVLPLSTAPPGRANLSIPSENVFFLSVLFIITALQRGPDHERAGLEKETSEPPRGKREKADPDAPISACMANIDDSLTESTTTTSPGILLIERNREKAGGRDFQSDRVESMRRHDWKSHKETCTGNQKYICLLIHPLTSSSGPESRDMRMDCMEPFHLKSYGNWGAEMRELRERLGWAKADYPPTLTLPPWLRLSTTGKEANMMRLLAGSVPPHPFPPELETRCQRDESTTTTSPGISLMEMREQESMRPGKSLRACSIPPQHFPSYAANAKFLLHSRPSPPICPLLTCISQSAQSLHSPFLQNGFFEITAPIWSLNEPDFFYANLKYLALLGART